MLERGGESCPGRSPVPAAQVGRLQRPSRSPQHSPDPRRPTRSHPEPPFRSRSPSSPRRSLGRGRGGEREERASERARPDWMAADARPSLAAERAAPPARAAATSRPLKVAAQLPAWPRPPLGPSDSGRAGQWLLRLRRRRLGAVGLGVGPSWFCRVSGRLEKGGAP